jgi:hypothetical protein
MDRTGEFKAKLVRLRRPKIACSPQMQIIVLIQILGQILLGMGHILRSEPALEE